MKSNTLVVVLITILVLAGTSFAGNPKSGTTLAGYKTIDICYLPAEDGSDSGTWRYSGVISVWNQGAVDTVGFTLTDFVEYKTGNTWRKGFDVPITYSGEIPAGTTQTTALTFPYSMDYTALPGTIRNNATLTILNHSGYIGTPFGPNPKATFAGTVNACVVDLGCTLTQGYWGTLGPDENPHTWPAPYDRSATFFLSGQTWQQVMDTPVNVSQGYYQLAHQYIAAELNEANGAYVPQGVQATLDLASAWLGANGPSACTANGSCGTQKDWAATLDLYNNGLYPGGPGHCGD